MADVNHIILIGRLTRDAELKYTSGGTAVCKFSIAIGKRKKQGEQWVEETSFFDVVAWGKIGESLNKYLVKGKQVAVEGELHQNRWEQDGQNRSKVEIIANGIQLLGGNDKEKHTAGHTYQGDDTRSDVYRGDENTTPQSRNRASADNDDVPPDYPDDIPF